MNKPTLKQQYPDVQVFFTPYSPENFYISVIDGKSPLQQNFIKFKANKLGVYTYKKVKFMQNIEASCQIGYHYDYMGLPEIRAILDYLEENYTPDNLVALYNENAYLPF